METRWEKLVVTLLLHPRMAHVSEEYEWEVQRLLEEYNGECEPQGLGLIPKDRGLVKSYFMYTCPILTEYGYNPVLYAVRKIQYG